MNRWRERLGVAIADLDASRIAASLDLSINSYYKRMRGEVPFSAFHFALLSERFGLSTELGGDPTFRFKLGQRPGSLFDKESYVSNLQTLVNHFTKTLDPATTELEVSSSDIPVFHLFAHPELAAVKLHYFESTHNHDLDLPFDLEGALVEQSNFIGGVGEIAREYSRVTSIEIWGTEPLMTLLAQLGRLARARCLDRSTAERLFDALQRVVVDISEAIQHKRKSHGGSFTLSINSLYSTSSLFALRNQTDARFCLTFDNPRYLYSAEAQTCSYFRTHFKRLYNPLHG